MTRVLRSRSTWCAIVSVGCAAGLIVVPAPWLEAPVPGGIPVGNLLAAASLFGAGLVGFFYSKPGSLLRLFSAGTSLLGLAWLPMSAAFSGNLTNTFINNDVGFMLWFRYTAITAVLGLVTMIATLAVAIRDYRNRLYGDPPA